MRNLTPKKSLLDAYHFKGCKTKSKVKSHPKDPKALVITLVRRQKKLFAAFVAPFITAGMTVDQSFPVIYPVVTTKFILSMRSAGSSAGHAMP